MNYTAESLQAFVSRVLRHMEVPPADAELAAGVLVAADLRGIESHGVARLRAYFDMLAAGRINPRPRPRVLRETASTATVDGDNGLGLVVGPWANDIALDKAESVGSGWVAVCNSNHFGIAGWYAMRGLDRNVIGWAMTNSTPVVTPLFGSEARLGTNPFAIAFPGLEEPPVVVDFATSAASYGKIEIALRSGRPIPAGWGLDAEGRDTTDPRAVAEGGSLLPIGSNHELGGHKGYALGMAVDILSTVLSGANWGPYAPPFMLHQAAPPRSVGRGIGHFFGALSISGFIDPEEFRRQLDDLVRTFRATRPAPGTTGPLIPGDPERNAESERRACGIPLSPAVAADLSEISTATGIPLG